MKDNLDYVSNEYPSAMGCATALLVGLACVVALLVLAILTRGM